MKKKNAIIAMAFAAILGTAFKSGDKKGDTYKLNTEISSIEWVGKKVTGEHKGNIKISQGDLIVSEGAIAGGNVNIDMNSITCTDMQGEYADKLVGHLKNDDFFSTDKFPASTFEITKITPLKETKDDGHANYTIEGKITIKGVTENISFPAYVMIRENNLAASGEAVINRTKFGIKYGSASFIEGLGDKAIYDDFIIKFKLAAKKS